MVTKFQAADVPGEPRRPFRNIVGFFRQITLEYHGGLLTGLCVGITAGMAVFVVPLNGKEPDWFMAWCMFGCAPLAWIGLALGAYGFQQRKKSN
jgi:hypothetical protein